jgi:hypothetical protein
MRKEEDVATVEIKEERRIKVHMHAESITIESSFTYNMLTGAHIGHQIHV